MRKFYSLWLLGCNLFIVTILNAQSYVNYVPVVSGLSAPIEVVNAGDGSNRLFIVQQNGVIRIFENGGLRTDSFLYIRHRITYGGEQGLLSMAFHPDYESNGYFYLYYNDLSGAITIARYNVSALAHRADSLSGQVMLTIPKPFTNHNGGHLQFAADGTLFFATGDGGSGNDPGNRAQDSTSLLGKMIRIDVNNASFPYYTVPASNPFYNTPNFDNRIWARGLRNSFRWSFDRLTGDMWIGDVGQGAREEINFRPASSIGGENYGWRCYEGFIRNPNIAACDVINYVPPVFDYRNPPGRAVVGGYVYRGSEYPSLYGYYIATDTFSDSLYMLKPNGNGGWNVLRQRSLVGFVVSFGEGEDGSLFAVSQGTNTIYKVVPSATLPVNLQHFTAVRTTNGNELKWTTTMERGRANFVVEYSLNGIQFEKAGEVMASGNVNGGSYSFVHAYDRHTTTFYRLAVTETDGSLRYSSVIKLNGKEGSYLLYPTVVRDGRFFVNADISINKLQVINNNGIVVYEKSSLSPGLSVIGLPQLTRGMYIVRLSGNSSYSEKIIIE